MKNKIIRGLFFVFLFFGVFSCFEKGKINEETGINRDESTILVASFNALRLG